MRKKAKKTKLLAKTFFDKNKARRFNDISYQAAQNQNLKDYELIEREKARLSTRHWQKITDLLDMYKNAGFDGYESSVGKTLLGLFKKNKNAVLNKTRVLNERLIGIVAKPEMLLLAYREIKGNKGALTPGAYKDKQEVINMTEEQRTLYFNIQMFPDGFSINDVLLASRLIRKGLYPWGSSQRVYFDKPGSNKKRPITIPPFMDRVVQKAIELVLHSIYEPVFEKMNRSFGFRPNKGYHDAIVALTSKITNGMRTAVEGDVEAAYDTVDKKILLKILGERISDSKFLNLIKARLNYDYVEKESGIRFKPELGIPQGGIDSPYLFNIYMHELDEYVHTVLYKELEEDNDKKLGPPGSRGYRKRVAKEGYRNENRSDNELRGYLPVIKSKIKRLAKILEEDCGEVETQIIKSQIQHERLNLFRLIRKVRLLTHKNIRRTTINNTKRELRIFYVRYADDWILLTNGNVEVANTLKQKIAKFLSEELKLNLSPTKTLITDITKNSAKFLGFEIRGTARGPRKRVPVKSPIPPELRKHKKELVLRPGLPVWASPDRQRQLDRMHMKGLCDKKGFPRELPWLSTYEPHIIVERYNAAIRGLANAYLGFIRTKSHLTRWIYILRFSCLKTLAQKYKTSISGIFKRFGHNMHNKSTYTIRITATLKLRDKTYEKSWDLLTYRDCKLKAAKRDYPRNVEQRFWDIEKRGLIGEYPQREGRVPKVTNIDYIEALSWVNLRTQAAFDMPCALCGKFENVEMHHIRHVRKTAYRVIPQDQVLEKMLALRNRKQTPICKDCHMKQVHKGIYDGPELIKFAPRITLVDNRILHVESFVHPGAAYTAAPLEEKGWIPIPERPS